MSTIPEKSAETIEESSGSTEVAEAMEKLQRKRFPSAKTVLNLLESDSEVKGHSTSEIEDGYLEVDGYAIVSEPESQQYDGEVWTETSENGVETPLRAYGEDGEAYVFMTL